jgi:cytochrome c553
LRPEAPFRLALAAFALAAASANAFAQAEDDERAARLVESKCSFCHGLKGESASEFFPRLAGQHREYLAKELADFKEGRRTGEMTRFAKTLSPGLIEALARYFSAQPAVPRAPEDPVLAAAGRLLFERGNAEAGVPPCASCHGTRGEGGPRVPRLAGQYAPYVARQLKDFDKRARTNDNEIMQAVASKLSLQDIRAVAEYAASIP